MLAELPLNNARTVKIILNVKRKKYNYKTVIECGKKMSKIFIGSKKTCLGVLDRGNRGKENETGLKKREE